MNNLNIHYVNLDLSPALDLPMNKDKLDWLRPHFGMTLSQYEKNLKERPDQGDRGVLVNIKESITALFYNYTGIDGPEKQSKIFGLTDPTNGGVYTLIFVNDIKLDLASHTLIADACAVPLYRALMVKISPALQRLTDRGLNQIVTLSDEAKVWRLLLPVVAERCRTWNHTSKCEYKSRGIPVALEGPEESPLCSCGKGKDLGAFGKLMEWKLLHAHATRIAIGPLFSFSFMEDTLAKMKNTLNPPTASNSSGFSPAPQSVLTVCSKCAGPGKPSLMVCSRCKKAKYCSRTCQNSHWKVHKRLCVAS